MNTRCPHCGSERPAVDDRIFRLACPACGGPRLPERATFLEPAAEAVATRALFRARIRAWRARTRLRLGGIFATMMTLFFVMRVTYTHHVRIAPVVMLGLVWTLFAISYARRHRRQAWRVRGALEDAYALAGLDSQLAVPRMRVRTAEPAAQTAQVIEEDPLEANDALADFDRRLAAIGKRS